MQLNSYFSHKNIQEIESIFSKLIRDWLKKQKITIPEDEDFISIEIPTDGEIVVRVKNFLGEPLEIRSLQEGDTQLLERFGEGLSDRSKDLFAPYPWGDKKNLERALQAAIEKSVNGVDAGFVVTHGNEPVGHFFLWHAGGNEHSKNYGVDIPELGVAVTDPYQGRKLGLLSVTMLQELARGLNKDAVELTTALSNDSGWNLYLHSGFEYIGLIRNPLEVDVVEAAHGHAQATRFREERQMVYIINGEKRDTILRYLEEKRRVFENQELASSEPKVPHR